MERPRNSARIRLKKARDLAVDEASGEDTKTVVNDAGPSMKSDPTLAVVNPEESVQNNEDEDTTIDTDGGATEDYSTPNFFLNNSQKTSQEAAAVSENTAHTSLESSPEPDFPDLRELLHGTQSRPDNSQQVSTSSQRPQPSPSKARSVAASPKKKRKAPQNEESTPVGGTSNGKEVKRPRQEESGLQKSREFWHLDGSVVIQVGNVAFKLIRSQLARQSSLFSNLFDRRREKATPVADEENEHSDTEDGDEVNAEPVESQFDGCDQYILHNITAHDFTQLLSLIEDALSYAFVKPEFPFLASVLRASTALGFDKHREWAVKLLTDMWPDSLSDVDNKRIPNATATILLADQCDVPGVRKRAYYELLRSTAFQQELDGNDDDLLGKEDLLRLIKAREHLVRDWSTTISPPPIFNPCAASKAKEDKSAKNGVPAQGNGGQTVGCISGDQDLCDLRWLKLLRSEDFRVYDYLHDPIMGLKYLIETDWEEEGFCKECDELRANTWEKQREKLWQNLDVWLSLHETD